MPAMLLVLGALACRASPSEGPLAPVVPAPEVTVRPTVRPDALDPDQAKALALQWGTANLGLPAGAAAAIFLGTQTGYPAFTVYSSANPRRPGTDVVVRGSEVLAGEDGFRAFVRGEGLQDAARIGAAFAFLIRNSPEEPRPGATLQDGTLTVDVVDARGTHRLVTATITADGGVTVVSERVLQ